MMINQKKLHLAGNLLGLQALITLLFISFYVQLIMHELPCPLCLLQRVAFVGVGVAIIFNLTIKIRPLHYGLMLLSALLGLVAASRQVLLHIIPGDAGYGPPVLGLHIYTWSAILFFTILVLGMIALLFDKGFHQVAKSKLITITIALFLTLVAANAISALLECGLGACPGNPTTYQLLSG